MQNTADKLTDWAKRIRQADPEQIEEIAYEMEQEANTYATSR